MLFQDKKLSLKLYLECPRGEVVERQDRGKNCPAAILPRDKQMSHWALWVLDRRKRAKILFFVISKLVSL